MCLKLLQYIILAFFCVVQIRPEKCLTPNKENAECISLYACTVILKALANQTSETVDFVRQSHCGKWNSETEPKVCCGSKLGFVENIRSLDSFSNVTETPVKKNVLSDKRYCGYQHTDDYFYTGNETSIDEFPWLVVFVYKFDDDITEEYLKDQIIKLQYGCSGAVINARYVLSAAQCMRLRVASAVAARLGEYNIRKERDCTTFQQLEDCSDPIEDVPFERKIIHPGYNRKLGINDIALIRLSKTTFFTDYIRPICLPIPGTQFAKPGDVLLTTGFGVLIDEVNKTVIKKKIFTKLITNEECKQQFAKFSDRTRNVNEDLMCAIDLRNNTVFSCEGDSGAPLMISKHKQWHMEGFTVWGASVCGSEDPGVYVKIVNYLEWIEKTIQPW